MLVIDEFDALPNLDLLRALAVAFVLLDHVFETLAAKSAFTVHPYKYPTVGSMRDLEAASVEDVRDFYQTFYVPSNATAILVGDFDPAQAKQLINQYLGRVPAGRRTVPRDIPKEPPLTRERRVTLSAAVPLPAVVVAHHVTYDGHLDS